MPDIRLEFSPATANDQALDAAIRHAVFIQRFKSTLTRRAALFLEERVFPELVGRLMTRVARIRTRGLDRGPVVTRRIREAVAAISEGLQKGMTDLRSILTEELLEQARVSSRSAHRSIVGGLSEIGLDVRLPSAAILRSVVLSRPFQGRLLRDWFRDLDQSTRRGVRSAVETGISIGDTNEGIARRVRSILGTTRNQALAITRTAVNHVQAHARESVYAENEQYIKAVRYVATLDSRTTDTCASLDGRVFPINEGERPPMHHQCRSTTSPVLKSWKELGINLNEAPVGTRASLNGQVPGDLTYNGWLRRMDRNPATRGIVDEALGRERARLFRSGLDIDRFVDSQFRPLTLRQIAAREGIAA